MKNTYVFRAPAPSLKRPQPNHDQLFSSMGLEQVAAHTTEDTEAKSKKKKSPQPQSQNQQKKDIIKALEEGIKQVSDPKVKAILEKTMAREIEISQLDPVDEESEREASVIFDDVKIQVQKLSKNKDALSKRIVAMYEPLIVKSAKEPTIRLHEFHEMPDEQVINVGENIYAKIVSDLNEVSKRALIPLLNFTGMVASRLRETDLRPFMLYRDDNAVMEKRLEVFDASVKTREEFLATTRDAGPALTTMMLSTLEAEAEANIARADAADAMRKPQIKLIEACFGMEELDRPFDANPHPAFVRSQLEEGIERDEHLIRSLREELQTVQESLVAERSAAASQVIIDLRASLTAKRREITEKRLQIDEDGVHDEGSPGYLAQRAHRRELEALREELADLEQQLEDNLQQPRARLLRLHQRERDIYQNIALRQHVMRDRHMLHETRNAIKQIGMSDVERRFAPAWAFEVMGSAIYRRVLSTTTLAAFDVALAHVNRIPGCETFTMKELICSKSVADMFAFLVAANWISSGDGSESKQSSRRGGGGDKSRHNYLNVTRVRELVASKIETCKVWFESVVRMPNPLCKQFERLLQSKYADKLADPNADQQAVEDWKLRMEAYQKMLPQHELVYVG